VATLSAPVPASAQAGPAVAGTVLGAAGGAYLSVALTTAAARAGLYAFSPRQALWLATPIPLGAVAGGVVGYRSRDALRGAAYGGLLGLAGGTLVGIAIGRLAWDEDEAVWASAIVTGGLGLLVGSLWGGLHDRDVSEPAVLAGHAITISLPFSP